MWPAPVLAAMNAAETDLSHSPFGPGETFATHYCRSRGVATADFADTLLQEALYPHARLVRFLLPDRFFAADRIFAANIGRIHRRREFNNVMLDFTESYENHMWLRDTLHLRVSVKRMQAIVWDIFAEAREKHAPNRPPPG